MRPLILDNVTVDRLQELAAYADKNRYTVDEILDVKAGRMITPGEQKEFVCFINFGFKVVYTVEEQNENVLRHLSVRVDKPGVLPSEIAVEEIMKIIGFTGGLRNCYGSVEEMDNDFLAINIWQIIKS